jgi:hypothetical protein
MAWSHQRVRKRPRDIVRFNAEQVRSEARKAAREYALQTKGPEHLKRVQTVIKRAERREKKKKWFRKVERGLRLQDREIMARKWLLRRGATTGSDFSPAERSELRRWFDALDTDGGGDIDLAELAAPLLSTGIASSIPQVRNIIEKNEIEEGGGIDFESFQRLLKRGIEGDRPGPDDGLSAMQQLRSHVEAAQTNTGLNLDSRINETRRTILLDALKEIRYSGNENENDRLLEKKISLLNLKNQDNEDEVRKLNLQKRRDKAAKAQRKEDKMLALWRVVLGSKRKKIAGCHLGQLPPVAMDRGKVYAEWAEKVPRMHADSDVKRHEWQQVNHWLKRSCDPNDVPKNKKTTDISLHESQSAPSFVNTYANVIGGDNNVNVVGVKKRPTLERLLSSYLRPTRADIARSKKMRQKIKRGKTLDVNPPKSVARELKPRQFPPFNIVASEKLQVREVSIGRK